MYIWRRLTSGPGSPASPSSPLGPGVPLGPWRWKRHAGKTTDSTLHDVCGDEDAYRLTDVSTGPRMTLKKTEVECKVNYITFIVPQSGPPSHTWKPGHPAVPFPGIPTSPWNKGTDTFILAQTESKSEISNSGTSASHTNRCAHLASVSSRPFDSSRSFWPLKDEWNSKSGNVCDVLCVQNIWISSGW